MAIEILTKTDLWIGMGINGIVTGFSVAIGTYLAQKHFLGLIKKLFRKRK